MTTPYGSPEAREAILLVGGYDVVGSQVAAPLHRRDPSSN